MTTFGDFTDDDAYDTAAADPEQVARKLHRIRLARTLEDRRFDELDPAEQTVRIAIVAALLDWLRRQGAL